MRDDDSTPEAQETRPDETAEPAADAAEATTPDTADELASGDSMGVPAVDEHEEAGAEDSAEPAADAADAAPNEPVSIDALLDEDAKEDAAKPEWSLPKPELTRVVEALLFASGKVMPVSMLEKAVPQARRREIREVLQDLVRFWDDEARGIHLEEVSGGFQFRTSNSAAPFIREMLKAKPMRLSRAALETLAIIAYRQPITRAEIEDVRGVDSGGVMKWLLDHKLARILGKREEPGRPIVYGTTKDFLELFHLRNLKELPTLQDFHELNAENQAKLDASVKREAQPAEEEERDEDAFFKVPETQADASHAAQELARAAEGLELAIREADQAVADVLGRKPYDEAGDGETDTEAEAEVEVLGTVGGPGKAKSRAPEPDAHDGSWQEPTYSDEEAQPDPDEEKSHES